MYMTTTTYTTPQDSYSIDPLDGGTVHDGRTYYWENHWLYPYYYPYYYWQPACPCATKCKNDKSLSIERLDNGYVVTLPDGTKKCYSNWFAIAIDMDKYFDKKS